MPQYRTGKGLLSLAWQDFWQRQPAAPYRPNPCCCSFLLLWGSQAACLTTDCGPGWAERRRVRGSPGYRGPPGERSRGKSEGVQAKATLAWFVSKLIFFSLCNYLSRWVFWHRFRFLSHPWKLVVWLLHTQTHKHLSIMFIADVYSLSMTILLTSVATIPKERLPYDTCLKYFNTNTGMIP